MARDHKRRHLFPRSLGLRARITIAFGLGALVLSAILASVTYGLARENLLDQREAAATERVLSNAVSLQNSLEPTVEDVTTLLASLPSPEGAYPLVRYRGGWTSVNSVQFGQEDVPLDLQDVVASGEPASMRYQDDGRPLLVVGVPIPGKDALYFEGASLEDVEDTLDGIAIALLGASVVTTFAGAALGFTVSRRVLTPLTDVGAAAEAIAGGRLDTRLDTRGDPDLRALTTSFNEMAQALQTRIERDARFASEVSHELRSPLMTLAASVEVLENNRDDLAPRSQTALDLLSVDIERFQQLVEDLLEISRFDAGAVQLDLAETLAADLVRQAADALTGGRVPVTVDPGAEELVVDVDRRRFGQVLANLIDNAEKYADGATAIAVSAAPGAIRIAVEDEGPGVPVEERELIFDRFSRGSAGGRRGTDLGTGLGLSLVSEHVRLHGGRVWVEDRLDRHVGSRFVVELPATPLGELEEPAEDEPSVHLSDVVDPDEALS